MWPSLLKIQYTELKLSCGYDPVVKNYIYSNSDLDLWPNDPKINRVLPLPHGNHVAKFGKDPIYRTKVIVWKPCGRPPYPITKYGPSRDGRIKTYIQAFYFKTLTNNIMYAVEWESEWLLSNQQFFSYIMARTR